MFQVTTEGGVTVFKVFTDDVTKKQTYSFIVTVNFQSHGGSNSVDKEYSVTIVDYCETQFSGQLDPVASQTYIISHEALIIDLPLAFNISPDYCETENYEIIIEPQIEDAGVAIFDANQMTL